MNARSELILKGFLSRCTPEMRVALEKFLPESERNWIKELPECSTELNTDEFAHGTLLERVHWSWFLPTLKSYSEKEQRLFLSALSPIAAENIRQSLHIEEAQEQITETARAYFREQLLHSLVGADQARLPIEYLPVSPLNALLTLNKKQLIRLIDLLPLSDLVQEMRQIVETKILKKIYSFLTEEQRGAIKQIAPQKETSSLPKMGLDRWDGEEDSLRNLLHRRGLARLGVALSGQHPDLIWTLCHQLDIGRGTALFKLCGKEAVPEVADPIIRQIEELMERL